MGPRVATLPPLLAKLEASPAWSLIKPQQRQRLSALLGGATNETSRLARRWVHQLTRTQRFTRSSPEVQAQRLTDVLTRERALPFSVAAPAHLPQANAYALVEREVVANFPFAGVTAEARVWRLIINGVPLQIAEPHVRPRDYLPAVRTVARVLTLLPPPILRGMQWVILNPVPSPANTFWAKQFGKSSFHSVMSASAATRTIYVLPNGRRRPEDIYMTLAHELGHVLSGQCWGEDHSGPGWQAWLKAMQEDGLCVSQYAGSNIGEDVAETTAAYVTSQGMSAEGEYRAMLGHRFRILDALLGAKLHV